MLVVPFRVSLVRNCTHLLLAWRFHASVADAPVLMWARPLIPCGVPIWSSVLQWKRLQDAGWGALGAPRPIAYYADRPASVTPVTGYCRVSS